MPVLSTFILFETEQKEVCNILQPHAHVLTIRALVLPNTYTHTRIDEPQYMCTYRFLFIFSPHIVGGYELVYRFLGHVLGISGKFSGVPMHMGHFNKHHRFYTFSDGYHASFSDDNWRTFLQSAVALWMRNVGGPTPCCDLRFIGGDGTSIGIPLGNLSGFKSVWEPSTLVDMPQTEEASRSGRVAVVMTSSNPECMPTPSFLQKLRTSLRLALGSSVSDVDFGNCLQDFHNHSRDLLPIWFSQAFLLFTRVEGRFREALRVLLRNCISEASVTTLITRRLLPVLTAAYPLIVSSPKIQSDSLRLAFPFGHEGVLNEIIVCINLASERPDGSLEIVAALIRDLSEFILNFESSFIN